MAAPSFLRERLHPAPEVEGVVGPGVLLGVAQTPSGQKPPPPDAPKRRLLATGGVMPPSGRPFPGVRMRVRIRTNERSRSRLPRHRGSTSGRSLTLGCGCASEPMNAVVHDFQGTAAQPAAVP